MAHLRPQKHYNHLDVSELTKIRHSPVDLARRAQHETTRREMNLSHNQRSVLAKYKRQQIWERLSSNKFRDEEVMKVYFDFFDELFYCSSLKKYCKVKLSSPSTENHANFKWRALIWSWPPKAHLLSAVIRIFRRAEITENMTRRIFYLGRLLHEITHTFLELYSCWYTPCRECLQHLGPAGHGFAWQDIAYALEKAANDSNFLNIPVQLDRYDSLLVDLDEIKEHVPHLDLSRWGFDKQEHDCEIFECEAQACSIQPLTNQVSEIGGFSSYNKYQPN
jgi:hypothetical protein